MHTGAVVLLKEEARHLVSDGARDRVASGFRGTQRHSGSGGDALAALRAERMTMGRFASDSSRSPLMPR